jgi:PAS domain S-box-containing protein
VERRRAEDARLRAEKERRNNEERERRRAAELRAVLESVPAIIWIAHDPECHTVTGNPAAQRFLRLTPDANSSLSAPDKDRPSHFTVMVDGRVLTAEELPVQRAARGEEVRNFEEEVRFSDGTSRYLLGNATPLRDEEGNPRGGVAAFVDITDRRRTELALQNSQEHLQLALEAGKMGAWHWDTGSGRVQWSPGLEQIHGLEPGSFEGTFEAWKRLVVPDDLPAALDAIEKALTTGDDYHVLYRVLHADGSVRWLEGFGRLVAGDEGGGHKMAGVCMDVTERKQADSQRDFLVQELSHRKEYVGDCDLDSKPVIRKSLLFRGSASILRLAHSCARADPWPSRRGQLGRCLAADGAYR